MTALRPIEISGAVGISTMRYPTNLRCAMPDCTELADSVHHCFPRSLIGNSSYFVRLNFGDGTTIDSIPHAVGLCGSGTTGHHGDLEEHRAWVKLEDGEFVWYQRVAPTDPHDEIPEEWQEWVRVGPLNPQPGSREGKPKRKRTQKGTEERTARKTVSVRLPEGVSGDDWDELVSEAEKIELAQPDTAFDPARGGVAIGKLLVAVLERFTGRAA